MSLCSPTPTATARLTKRELLFTGISGKDHDHGVHAFVFAPDGKLYFNMGTKANSCVTR